MLTLRPFLVFVFVTSPSKYPFRGPRYWSSKRVKSTIGGLISPLAILSPSMSIWAWLTEGRGWGIETIRRWELGVEFWRFGSRERCWYEVVVADDLAVGVFVSLATTAPLRRLRRFIDGIPDCRWTRGFRGCDFSEAGEGDKSGEGDFERLNIVERKKTLTRRKRAIHRKGGWETDCLRLIGFIRERTGLWRHRRLVNGDPRS